MAKNIIDLDAMAYRDTGVCEIKHPVSKSIIGRIECHSSRSPVVIAFDDAQAMKDAAEDREHSKARIDAAIAGNPEPTSPKDARTPDAWRDRAFSRLAAHVIKGDFEIKVDGKTQPFTAETAFAVFKSAKNDWLTAQFADYVGKTENFTPNSADA